MIADDAGKVIVHPDINLVSKEDETYKKPHQRKYEKEHRR